MEITIPQNRQSDMGESYSILEYLKQNETALMLSDAIIYSNFPVYRGSDDETIIIQFMILSKHHGLFIFRIDDSGRRNPGENVDIMDEAENSMSAIYSRLVKNKSLRSSPTVVKVPVYCCVFSSDFQGDINPVDSISIIQNLTALQTYISTRILQSEISQDVFNEIVVTIEGTKGITKSKERLNVAVNSKGDIVNKIEKEITKFDEIQKIISITPLIGLTRIRGLAGSGKTVVLCYQAALTHLKNPNKKIVYTFYTKSLYQHIISLITRFYRQFDDNKPNWNNLIIMHGWGSSINKGVYYDICRSHEISPIPYIEAAKKSKNPFQYVCNELVKDSDKLKHIYDYIFIDEGQDFPNSFIQLCLKVTQNNNLIWAYDDLQTIFQNSTPTAAEVFGSPSINFVDDWILHKCYRNPRQIIFTAHAIGFSIYGSKICQMINSEQYWEDIGYKIVQGSLKEGDVVKILRPEESSLKKASELLAGQDIIITRSFDDYGDELLFVCQSIKHDIENGLVPEDIAVICVDDKHASGYLNSIQGILLSQYNIETNNLHSDNYSIRDFQRTDCVTLTTVHKAKGNEAYSVYIVGVDAVFTKTPNSHDRNILFTAMTRSKAWLTVTGMGSLAKSICDEIEFAKRKFPYLEFVYPSESALRIMKRDIPLDRDNSIKRRAMVNELLKTMSEDELIDYIKSNIKKYEN